MSKCKKVLSIVLAIIILGSICNISVSAKTSKKNSIKWNYNKKSCTLIIKGKGSISNYKDIWSTPWKNYRIKVKTIEVKKGIKSIGKNAFSNFYNLKEVKLSLTVSKIKSYAFTRCYKLSKIDLKNIKKIEFGAFDSCFNLKSVNLKNLTSLGAYAFVQTGLKEVKFGKKLKTINKGTFRFCSKLNKIILPKNIKKVKSNAFSRNSNMHFYIYNKEIDLAKDFFGVIDPRDTYYIHSYKNSNAEQFAKRNNVKFCAIKK